MKPCILAQMTETEKLQAYLKEPVCGASLAVFRIGFGLLLVIALIRFWFKGWIASYYLRPQYYFSYIDWIRPWPAWGMYLHFAILIAAALAIALGWQYRKASLIFFLGFSWVELLDKTPYLNHYYAISIFAFLLILLPLDQAYSIRQGKLSQMPRWCLIVLQIQLGIIYVYAGIAKINPDWLLAAEPLRRWLISEAHLPMIGPWLLWKPLPWMMAWAGMLFDLSIPCLLSNKYSRVPAYLLLLVFHGFTAYLFPIGVFPWLMSFAALVYFSPDWPLKLLSKLGVKLAPSEDANLQIGLISSHPLLIAVLVMHFCLQLYLPMRYLNYPGFVLWHEKGFRFSWRVMLMEKTGSVEYQLREGPKGKIRRVQPKNYLTPFQLKMMSTQPDMILQFAHFLCQQELQKNKLKIAVYAEAFAALNGRPSQYLINPKIDLCLVPVNSNENAYIVPLESP
jgi:vitamin K-dependent gamma-carboxylase